MKVLGIKWNPDEDAFQFEVLTSIQVPITKRAILSLIAKIYDPLGWLTPVVVIAKIFLQQLWLSQCNWDDVIPAELLKRWQNYYLELPVIRNFLMSRWSGHGTDTLLIEIHGFADASTSAYGAVVYLRIVKVDGSVQVTMLTAKSRVAPLKPVIPEHTSPRTVHCRAACAQWRSCNQILRCQAYSALVGQILLSL